MPLNRKIRTADHVRADIAARFVEFLCAKAGFTTRSPQQGSDYGIDISVQTFDQRGFIENDEIKIQVKAVKRLRALSGGQFFGCELEKRDLDHWLEEFVPVIFVVYEEASARAYWCYIQRYFAQLRRFDLKKVGKFRTIRIAKRDVLTVRAIRQFARWKNDIFARAKTAVKHG